jgi:hypothetical protein
LIAEVPQISTEIQCAYTDPTINDLLKQAGETTGTFIRHYNQVEEFFLRFDKEYSVPQLPIHHDVRNPIPEQIYIRLLSEVIEQLITMAPQLFRDLTHLFNPTETLNPSFFNLYRFADTQYLYLLRLDLMHRPQLQRATLKGTNDATAAYSSNLLFLESTIIPLKGVQTHSGKISSFVVDQTISNTWVDETGRGYFVQGIWIDNDLTKFFSKLFLPPGKRTYPFYPFVCKYKTVCQNMIELSPERREKSLPQLHRALEYLRPALPKIEESMKEQSFSESNKTFLELKSSVPPAWSKIWQSLTVDVYLNEQNMKEYRIDNAAG